MLLKQSFSTKRNIRLTLKLDVQLHSIKSKPLVTESRQANVTHALINITDTSKSSHLHVCRIGLMCFLLKEIRLWQKWDNEATVNTLMKHWEQSEKIHTQSVPLELTHNRRNVSNYFK